MTSSSRHNEVAEAVFLDKNKVPGGNSEETVAEVESLQEPVENWDVVNIKEENVSEIASLKEAMESKLDTLNQDNIVAIEALKKSVEENVTAIASLKESVDAKINTLNQNVVNLNAKMEADTKQDNLRWAIENSSANEFEYYDADNGYSKKKSSGKLVRGILFSFRTGQGMFLPAKVGINQHYHWEQNKEKAVADFRDKLVAQIHGLTGQKPRTFHDKLVDQIHGLTGQKPRLYETEQGQYQIFYS